MASGKSKKGKTHLPLNFNALAGNHPFLSSHHYSNVCVCVCIYTYIYIYSNESRDKNERWTKPIETPVSIVFISKSLMFLVA